jgi:hypothetical protein
VLGEPHNVCWTDVSWSLASGAAAPAVCVKVEAPSPQRVLSVTDSKWQRSPPWGSSPAFLGVCFGVKNTLYCLRAGCEHQSDQYSGSTVAVLLALEGRDGFRIKLRCPVSGVFLLACTQHQHSAFCSRYSERPARACLEMPNSGRYYVTLAVFHSMPEAADVLRLCPQSTI